MGYLTRVITRLGGRRSLIGLGLVYVALALSFPLTPIASQLPTTGVVLVMMIPAASGLVLATGGYFLPRTSIRPDLYYVVSTWCLRAILVIVSLLVLLSVLEQMSILYVNVLILSGLASLAGFGMGYHDGQAKTRAVNAEEYSRELERYQTIVETVNDGIFVADQDSRFRLVNDAYTELVGYDRETLIGEDTSLVTDSDVALAEDVNRDLKSNTSASNTYETVVNTADGDTRDVEVTISRLPAESGAPHEYDYLPTARESRPEAERSEAEGRA